MMRWPHAAAVCCVGSSLLAGPDPAAAHSASDAYLTLSVDDSKPDEQAVHGQWDIAIRDLDFVLKLDDDGNGQVTWGEVRKHRAAIEAYAYRFLKIDGGAGNSCAIDPQQLLIDDHADGAYVSLFFAARCTQASKKLKIDYSLFFKIDPSHRGILVSRSGAAVATALLSPENARVDLNL